jgi:hypothetical protein
MLTLMWWLYAAPCGLLKGHRLLTSTVIPPASPDALTRRLSMVVPVLLLIMRVATKGLSKKTTCEFQKTTSYICTACRRAYNHGHLHANQIVQCCDLTLVRNAGLTSGRDAT